MEYEIKGERRFIFDPIPYGKDQNIRCVNQSKKGKPYLLINITQHWSVKDTFIRLYAGVEGRRIINVEPLQYLITEKNKTKRTNNNNKKTNSGTGTPSGEAGYINTGITLFEKKQMTMEQLNKLPSWKRYLYLIPNTRQPWITYRNIAMAIRSAGGKTEDFKEWAKLSTKYEK